MNKLREIDGMKIAFADHETYFSSFMGTPSMSDIARDTGADMVMLLASGKTEADITDDEIRAVLAGMLNAKPISLDDDELDGMDDHIIDPEMGAH